jgi:hypothetical protein
MQESHHKLRHMSTCQNVTCIYLTYLIIVNFSLRYLLGKHILFPDDGGKPVWCGHVNHTCNSCDNLNDQITLTTACSQRIMTPGMATGLAVLASYTAIEWPTRKLLVYVSKRHAHINNDLTRTVDTYA